MGPSATSVAADADLMARGVELQRADVHDLAFGDLEPAQRGANPRQQLALRERLDDVVVGTAVEPRDAVVFLAARRQHDDRESRLVSRIALQLARELEPADVGQHPVHQHEIGSPIGDRGARLARVTRGPHL